MPEDLIEEKDEQLQFLTPDEKVDELQIILQKRDEELETFRTKETDTDLSELRAKLEEADREKKALAATLESKQRKIDQLISTSPGAG
jgi:chromosome segregation ATPase